MRKVIFYCAIALSLFTLPSCGYIITSMFRGEDYSYSDYIEEREGSNRSYERNSSYNRSSGNSYNNGGSEGNRNTGGVCP